MIVFKENLAETLVVFEVVQVLSRCNAPHPHGLTLAQIRERMAAGDMVEMCDLVALEKAGLVEIVRTLQPARFRLSARGRLALAD